MPDLTSECPTACDADCDASCHEMHKPAWKWSHQPGDCPAMGARAGSDQRRNEDPLHDSGDARPLGSLGEVRRHAPATRQSVLTTVGRIRAEDWVRLQGHVDWRLAVGGVLTAGPMTRVLWRDRLGRLSSDMLMTEAPCEVVHGGSEAPGIEGA